MRVFQHEQIHLQYRQPCRKLLRVNDLIHLFKIPSDNRQEKAIMKFLPFNTILNPLMVSLSGTNLPGVPVKTSATLNEQENRDSKVEKSVLNKLGKVEKEIVGFYEHERQLIYHHQIIHPYPR